jgi:hypothetical protein
MGSTVSYVKKLDEDFYRALIEKEWNGESATILTYHENKPQGIFMVDEAKEVETETSEVEVNELWLCSVERDNIHYNRITIKTPSIIKHSSRRKEK